jgi:YD repeat-containing protein
VRSGTGRFILPKEGHTSGTPSSEEQSNASVKSRLLASKPMLSRDELGRLTRVTMSQGDFVQYRYNDQNQRVLEKTLFEGTTRDREESMLYFAAQKRQREYNLWLSGKSELTSRNLAKNASYALD